MLKNVLTGLSIGKILDVGTGSGQLIKHITEELKSFDEIDRFKDMVDKNLESIDYTRNYESLKVEGEKVKKWLETYSISDATELVILARNNKNN